jgi:hypothetical protein
VGVLPQPSISLRDSLGQDSDSDYDLLYAVYGHHADVSACLSLWAGGVTGNGWHIGLLDKEAKPTPTQQQQIDELTTWLKNPNPTKRFSRLLYELVAAMAFAHDRLPHGRHLECGLGTAYLDRPRSEESSVPCWLPPVRLRLARDDMHRPGPSAADGGGVISRCA